MTDKKYIVTKFNNNGKDMIFYGLHNGKEFYEVNVCDAQSNTILGNIYIGRVKDMVKNINCAFIEFEKGKVGYYSLENNKSHIFLNKKNSNTLVQGDIVIVQVEKDVIKTKDPVLTSNINLTGKYVAVNINKSGLGISSKIKDNDRREAIKALLNEFISEDYSIIVRTNAENAKDEDILTELQTLLNEWNDIYDKAFTRTAYTVLKKKEPEYLRRVDGIYDGEIVEIVTDDQAIYELISQKSSLCRLYEDKLLPLDKLYSVSNCLDNLLNKKVWLKCGGYLIIEQTEAMVVIDVNTGKYSKGKNTAEAILKVNTEAAIEIAKQIRLRNLSGIIIIDFINMPNKEYEKQVVEEFEKIVSQDPVKTDVIGMTKLGLLEVTRKKAKASISEIFK
ncbi:MAG: ribonuclease E/G [Lachnospiraceae bacterium]|nr:ribonuclease E/G [Lachnospiraceae bacterium]